MYCLLCLESINNFMDCIHVNSEMWKKQNLKYLIEKHLWPMNTIKFYSSVCSNCGQELFTFHTFYKRIEKAHTNMSIMVKTDNEMEDIGPNNSNYTTLDSEDELVSKVISSDHFNDSSLDIKDNDDYMECSTEPEILQEQLISEKVMLRQQTNESFFKAQNNPSAKEDNSYLISSDEEEVQKDTPGENSLEKNKKQLKDADNITGMLKQPTNKSFFKEKNNPVIIFNVIRVKDKKNQKIEECFFKSGSSKDTPKESEDSREKNKKQLKDADKTTAMLRQPTNESFIKETNNPSSEEDNSNIISSDDQEVETGTPKESEDSLEKNKKQLNDASNITNTLRQPTNEKFFKENNNPSSVEDNSNLISSDDQDIEKLNTAQHTKSDFSIRKIDTNNRKEANKEYDRIIAEHFKIKCNLCNISLENFMDLRDHFEVKHKQCAYVRCCNRTYYSRASLVDHIYAHIKPDYLKCKVCDKVFTSRYNLNYHSKLHGDKSELLKCDKCEKGFTTPSILKHHIENVHENKFVKICEICGKSIRCPNSFAQHVKNHETTDPHVSCDICGKLYVNEKGLKIHKKHQHPEGGKKYHKCDVCGQLLFSTLSLKRHKLSQHPEGGKKEQKCHICSKVSANPIALKEHIIAVHEKGYKYKCTMCERAFTRPRFLKEHLARHTGTALYTCTWCPKTFTASGNRYLHHKNAHPEEWQEHLRQLNAKKFNK